MTTDEFVKRAREIHGNKYDYSKTQYINSRTKVLIICPIHGEFYQRPDGHLSKHGCPKCAYKHEKSNEDIVNRKNIFLEKSKLIHNDKYDYSKVDYINVNTKVCIICPEHGEFWTTPENHIRQKVGCPVCKSKTRKCHKYLTTEEFIIKSKKIHGDKYDYSKTEYINPINKICIICPIHGEFYQSPNLHISGSGCPKCVNRLTTEEFINNVKEKYGDIYTFEKTKYVSNTDYVTITCKKHGDFKVTPNKLMGSNRTCPKCRKEKRMIKKTNEWLKMCKSKHGDNFDYSLITMIKNNMQKLPIICKKHNHTFYQDIAHHLKYDLCCPLCHKEYISNLMSDDINSFIKKSNETHKGKYDYSKVNYINSQTKVCIICPEHGEFYQIPSAHIKGYGCPKCAYKKTSLRILKTKEQFINDAQKVHGNKYDYSKVEYNNCKEKVKIICPIHGIFEQTPDSHISGSGCPQCRESKLEMEIVSFLNNCNIKYERQKKFDWLKYKKNLSLDFFLTDYNIAIECQGEQHDREVYFFTGKDTLEIIQKRDKLKKELCEQNNIKILYYSKTKRKPYYITNVKVLLNTIKTYASKRI